ncbi:MAG: NADH-quinone oxidoreductase subunit NuoF [Acidobacteriota bacterium]|nr:NADH-quinone oxidoreductase subunit NuoF [Acidobacteriota bacterium]
MAFEPILLRNAGNPAVHEVSGYRKAGGYEALSKALAMEPEEIIDAVKASGLRGRGGAGFPAGLKWSFIPKGSEKAKYLVCNADESEPGTFKDRILIETDPHQLIEGCAICCYAVGASTCYVYIRGEYVAPALTLERAIADAYEHGLLGEDVLGSGFALDMRVHRGAGAYICGEETGMLESLEGRRGQPRIKPPFPAIVGAFAAPTVINNVETLCNVPHIIGRGAEWFKSLGTDERNTGPKVYCISGHVERPGVYEYPIGVTLDDLIAAAGGMYRGRALKAYIPGGASAAILSDEQSGLPMDFDSLAQAGSMLGSAAVVVMDETTCLVRATLRLAKFFAHESCGQCTPCREGTNWSEMILARLEDGRGSESDIDLLQRITTNMSGTALCALADACVGPVRSLVTNFRPEVMQHVEQGCCPLPRQSIFEPGAVS